MINRRTLSRRTEALEQAVANIPGRRSGPDNPCMIVQTFDDTNYPTLPGTSEIQQLTSTHTGGTAPLTFDGQTTAPLAWNASAATVKTALEALSNIGAGNTAVTGGPLGYGGSAPLLITFVGSMANKGQPIIAIGGGWTGGVASVVELQVGNPLRYYAVERITMLGAETEGGHVATSTPSLKFLACNLGSTIPPIGAQVIIILVSGIWYFRYDG